MSTTITGLTDLPLPVEPTDRLPLDRGAATTGDAAVSDVLAAAVEQRRFASRTTAPPTPAANTGTLWARRRAGNVRPAWVAPSGFDYALQPGLPGNRVFMVTPNLSGALNYFGATNTTGTTAGALSVGVFGTATLRQSLARTVFATAATAGSQAFLRTTFPMWRGNAAGRGGFFSCTRWCVPATILPSGTQFFAGVGLNNAAWSGDPSTSLNDAVGLCLDAGDANWQVVSRQLTGVAAKSDTGIAYAAEQAWTLFIFAAPNASSIGYWAEERNSGAVIEGDLTSPLPANTAVLGPHIGIRNGANAAVASFEFVQMYGEVDD